MNNTESKIANIRSKYKKEILQEIKEAKAKDEELKHNEPQQNLKQTLLFKIQEDRDDAEHSKNNTALLNKIYSQIIKIIFNPFLFYPLILIIFICYVLADERFLQICNYYIIVYIAEKILHFITYFLVILLSFSTAKGIRKLFREIIKQKTKP